MSKFKIIWSIVFLIISQSSFAQQVAELKGRIVTAYNEPIEGASITFIEIKQGAKADQDGNFTIKGVPFGIYQINISAIGYKTLQRKFRINQEHETLKGIQLTAKHNGLAEVKINGKTAGRKIKDSGFNVNVIETKQYANTNSDVNQILNRSTGVKIREQGGLGSKYSFSLNGLSGNNIKFFIDGVPIESFGSG